MTDYPKQVYIHSEATGNTLSMTLESPYIHRGVAIIDGEEFRVRGVDVNPYTEYNIDSVKKNSKGYTWMSWRQRSTYLYTNYAQFLVHLEERYESLVKSATSLSWDTAERFLSQDKLRGDMYEC